MKTVLKRREIIEKLKKNLSVSSIEILRQTTLDISSFTRCYVLLIRYGSTYQTVNLFLRYGWVEIEFCNCYDSILPAVRWYLSEIVLQSGSEFDQYCEAYKLV